MPETLPLFPQYMPSLFDWKLRTERVNALKKIYCNQLHAIFFKKNGKSSQVNILIIDFYLLELSKYKLMKIKNKIDVEFSPQIENIIQEPSSQLS